MPKITNRNRDDWKQRPRIAIDPETHTALKILCAKERIPIGILADKIVLLGMEQWKASQEQAAS